MRSLGATMVETRLPDFPYGAMIGAIISVDAASVFEPLISSGKVDELADQKQIAGLKAGLEIPAHVYLKAMRIRRLAKEAIFKLFADVDVLLTPARLGGRTENRRAARSSSGSRRGRRMRALRP